LKTFLLILLAGLGLLLYLWPALTAPVVLWSDSAVDLDWARKGIGIFEPAPRVGHPAKPAYLLFLRGVLDLPLAGDETRRIVVVQSLILWASIVGTAIFLARKRGAGAAIAFSVLLFSFLRLRDASSAVMSETLSAALFLPIAACMIWPPRRASSVVLAGLTISLLFWARPNLGAIALALLLIRQAAARAWLALLGVAGAFLAAGVPVWLATRPPEGGDPLGGLSYPILEASADYYWRPSIEPWPAAGSPREKSRAELARARANWETRLEARGPDARREILWRAFHGLFGTEYYDARWSNSYGTATACSRILAPIVIAASIASLLVFGLAGAETAAGIAGALLCLALVAQDLLLGSNPRYVLPALPAVILFGIAGAAWRSASTKRRLSAVFVFAGLLAGLAAARQVLDWQWGKIEAPGVRLVQPIPKGALPPQGPATLHVRIASLLVPSAAGLDISGAGNRLLYSSDNDPARQRAYLTVPLPDWLLETNRAAPVELSFVSRGSYGAESFLLFPVIPPPWSTEARREGSDALSPSTGIVRGSLDWWAHAGSP
jgi:hypothetical protein